MLKVETNLVISLDWRTINVVIFSNKGVFVFLNVQSWLFRQDVHDLQETGSHLVGLNYAIS